MYMYENKNYAHAIRCVNVAAKNESIIYKILAMDQETPSCIRVCEPRN